MNNNFQVKEMTESMPMLKSSRANYIFISDKGFYKEKRLFPQKAHSDSFYEVTWKHLNISTVS